MDFAYRPFTEVLWFEVPKSTNQVGVINAGRAVDEWNAGDVV